MKTKPKILIYDIETLPNKGFFWHPYDDRSLPLEFIQQSKAIITIAYKFVGDRNVTLLTAKTPYNDKSMLEEFSKVWKEADYVLGHYIEGFDIPFINGRVMANKLDPLPPTPAIDTYKLAKKHFGQTLNSNKLDHLGELFGVGRKNKTGASLWVRCANGEAKAIKEMGLYNVQDVKLLEKVWNTMQPYVQSRLNMNHFSDLDGIVCSSCGSDNLQKRGVAVTKAAKKTRLHCQDCGAWSTMKYETKKEKGSKVTKPHSKSRKKISN